MMRKQLFSLLLVLASFAILASVAPAVPAGPGGIGDGSGTSDLRLWMRADKGALNSGGVSASGGQSVATWLDMSGYGNTATQGTNVRRPIYTANAVNGSLPVFTFDGTADSGQGQYLDMAHFMNFTEPTIYVIGRRTGGGVGSPFSVGGHSGPTSEPKIQYRWHSSSGIFWIGVNGTDETFSLQALPAGPTTNFHIGSMTVEGQTLNVNYNGLLQGTNTNAGYIATNFDQNRAPRIGRDTAITSYNLTGEIAEIIVYDHALNSLERLMIDNALSAKYDVAGLAAAVNKYDGDLSAKGNYDYDVFGIGSNGTNTILTSASAGLKLTAASLTNGQYLLAGHKTLQNGIVAVGNDFAWNRDYYLDVRGGAFAATLTFDFDEAGIGYDSHFSKLLFSSTENGPFSVVNATASYSGNQISFLLSSGMLQSGYYTIAGTIPEPNSLVLLGLGMVLVVRRNRRKA